MVFLLASPLILAHLCWRSWHDGGTTYLRQRLGLYQARRATMDSGTEQRPIWIHAASVGEINTVRPLLEQLLSDFPTHQFVVTTATPTGKHALELASLPRTDHYYLPLDFVSSVNRFYRHLAPQCGLIVETELWPMLYQQASIPLVLVNGRLSAKTLKAANSWLETAYRFCVSRLSLILARHPSDAAEFVALGASNVVQVGNLKHAVTALVPESTNATSNQKQSTQDDPHRDRGYTAIEPPFLPERRFVLLASTHNDEELAITQRWLQLENTPLLVIAPRHPDRAEDIRRQLNSVTDRLSQRSLGEPVDPTTTVYLADTFGELDLWYRHASAIFLGGSLVNVGGHNMLEPARLNRAVITGPQVFNFAEEVFALQQADAITLCADANEVVEQLLHQYNHSQEALARGQRAGNTIEQHRHVLPEYRRHILPYISA